ncbi:MAG: hypothetical protein Q8O00_14815, partial [Holophaga sp.]|nr:hypothetical protein [Holophaga sp.]
MTYAYNAVNLLATRTWARGTVTSYVYDPATGEQTGISYNDGITPALTYAFDRLGQSASVNQAVPGDPLFTWFERCLCGKVSVEHLDLEFFGSRALYYKLDYATVGNKGRTVGYALSTLPSSGGVVEQDITYGFDSLNRLQTLSSHRYRQTGPTIYRYSYLPASRFVNGLTVDGSPYAVTREFESKRNLLKSIVSNWGEGSPETVTRARFDYTYNALDQRVATVQSGTAFADYGEATFQLYTYNAHGELMQAGGFLGNNIADQLRSLPNRRHDYDYDPIGNRRSANRTGISDLRDDYPTNTLNQYVTKENSSVPLSGTAATGAIVAVSGRNVPAGRTTPVSPFWSDEITVNNNSQPWRGVLSVYALTPGTGGAADRFRVESRTALIPPFTEGFAYDADGNLLDDGLWHYTWDGENRLIALETGAAAATAGLPKRKLEFKYDYMGRRIEKTVTGWNVSNGTWNPNPDARRRYVYDGWNLVAEYAVSGSPSVLSLVRSYAWGLDLAQSMTETGGVGALLEIGDNASGQAYLPAYDGNGNIAALIN